MSIDERSFVAVVKLSLLSLGVRASIFFSFSSQGVTTVLAVLGVGGVIVFSSLDRRLSLLPSADSSGGVTVIGMVGDALGRPRTASLGIRLGASIASKSGLGDNFWTSRGISKNRFL